MSEQNSPHFTTTGHQETDSQHIALEQLIRQLDASCETRGKSGGGCIECPAEYRAECTDRLTALLGEVMDFITTHFSYEDKLMRQLPKTPAITQHVAEHKWAHAEIISQLTEATDDLDRENPKMSTLRIQEIIGACMGTHIGGLDVQLAGYLESKINSQ